VRIVRFGPLPDLRVSKVTLGGNDLDFIQEPRTPTALLCDPAGRSQGRRGLPFRTNPKLTLVSVGKRVEDTADGKLRKTRWVSEVPLAAAGFNLGRFKEFEVTDAALGNYVI
jgi:hypothetical protein